VVQLIRKGGGSKQKREGVMMVMMSGTGEGDLCRAMHACVGVKGWRDPLRLMAL
jgi:hypothetical protein